MYSQIIDLPELDEDFDGDGLSNADELLWGSNPRDYDTDNDGLNDRSEQAAEQNPRLKQDPKTQLRERYYDLVSPMLGWQDVGNLNWDILYQLQSKAKDDLGMAFDSLVLEKAVASGESPEESIYLLSQSPYVQWMKVEGVSERSLSGYVESQYYHACQYNHLREQAKLEDMEQTQAKEEKSEKNSQGYEEESLDAF